jgi:hypothetical protein
MPKRRAEITLEENGKRREKEAPGNVSLEAHDEYESHDETTSDDREPSKLIEYVKPVFHYQPLDKTQDSIRVLQVLCDTGRRRHPMQDPSYPRERRKLHFAYRIHGSHLFLRMRLRSTAVQSKLVTISSGSYKPSVPLRTTILKCA